jgi:DNA repair protein RecN (Recombination protein N)
MLRFLRIRRLAVIDSVEVEFDPGFNVLTGETGAGKSILVEAVGLLLGGRASGDLVRTGEEAATIEALFEHAGQERLIRREITAQGRSRAFIDGELVTAAALKEQSIHLIELHGQHEHQTLLDPETHRDALDVFGHLQGQTTKVGDAFRTLQLAATELARVKMVASEREARQELVAFQLAELEKAGLKAGEDTELATTRQVLASAERVERLCAESYAALYESDAAVLATLGGVWRRVADLAELDPRFQAYLDGRDGIKSQLEDLAFFLRRYADGIESSPARLEQIETRLALLERLKRRHGPTLSDVIAKRDALKRELDDLDNADQRVADLEQTHGAARRTYVSAAHQQSQARQAAALPFARALERGLDELAMERARFEVRVATVDEAAWAEHGVDHVEFFMSANPGEELRPLSRVASGGELSRVMLAMKTVLAGSRHGFSDAVDRPPSAAAPGLIFDEVDAGIGGRAADVVGHKLRVLGSAFQVLCITHLPQLAAYADTHFQIAKRVEGGRTRAVVTRLSTAARVEELSRMLGGGSVTDAIRASAREMLEHRRSGGESERAKGETIRPPRRSKPETRNTR